MIMKDKTKEKQGFKVRDLRRKEKFPIDDDYINGYARKLDPYATAVYLSLCRHADSETQRCFPSMERIAEQHNIGRRTVVKKIELLKKHNLIRKERERKKDGTFGKNIYFLLDKTKWKDYQVQEMHMDDNQVHLTTRPSASDDINQVQEMHTKDTHIKDTQKKERTPAQKMRSFLKEKEAFQNRVKMVVDKTGYEKGTVEKELKRFKSYWTEPTKSGKKQRWELERTFDLTRRIQTWMRKAVEYGSIEPFEKQKVKQY